MGFGPYQADGEERSDELGRHDARSPQRASQSAWWLRYERRVRFFGRAVDFRPRAAVDFLRVVFEADVRFVVLRGRAGGSITPNVLPAGAMSIAIVVAGVICVTGMATVPPDATALST